MDAEFPMEGVPGSDDAVIPPCRICLPEHREERAYCIVVPPLVHKQMGTFFPVGPMSPYRE